MINNGKHLNILIIDDSLFFSQSLKINLEKSLNINSIEIYNDSVLAYDRLKNKLPDIVILDVEMPKLNGIDFLKKIGKNFPIPIIVVSSSESKALKALEVGALEFIVKPNPKSRVSFSEFLDKLLSVIKGIKTTKITLPHYIVQNNINIDIPTTATSHDKIIAIGASTGGTDAILSILKSLPKNINGVVIAIHMPENFTNIFSQRLNKSCNIKVKEAKNLDKVEKGVALIAKGGSHMTIHKDFDGYYVKVNKSKRVNGHIPSIDVLFNSIAKLKNTKGIGVILTGMGDDGARGLLNMKSAGFLTIGQSEKDCIVYGMPLSAKKIGAICKEVHIKNIPNIIVDYVNK